MAGSSEFGQGKKVPTSLPELAQFISGLIDEVEKAKRSSAQRISSLLIERDEALRDLEMVLQERDELSLQVSTLKNELQVKSARSAELEIICADKSQVEKEASATRLQVRQLQAELEHYFLVSCERSKLLEASALIYERSTALLLKAVS